MNLNVPNALTLSRLLLMPVFVYAALANSFELNLVAAIVFGLAALTDWFDGIVARKLNQVTDFGKIADPVVDRILVAVALVILYIKLSALIPLWAVIAVVGRDILMVLGWAYIAHLGTRIKVTYEGKAATAILMFSVFFILFKPSDDFMLFEVLGISLFYIGMVLSLYSGLKYIKLGVTMLRNRRSGE